MMPPGHNDRMSAEPPASTPRLDLVIELLLIALLLFMPAAYGAVDPWSESIATAGGAALALLLVARTLIARRSMRISPWAWVPIVLFIAIVMLQLLPLPSHAVRLLSPHTFAVKTDLLDDLPNASDALSRMTLSFYPLATRHDLRLVLLSATVFIAVATVFRDPRRMRRLLLAITLIAAAAAILALAQDLTATRFIYWKISLNEPARNGPFFNHSHYAQFMNLSIGCALALLLTAAHARRWLQVALLTCVIVLGLATVWLSLSRGGTVGLVAAGVFVLFVLLTMRHFRRTGGIIAVTALLALASFVYLDFQHIYRRILAPDNFAGRIQMLRDAGEMIRQFPQVGVGLGGFEWVYPAYDRTVSSATSAYVENEYAQTLVETGPLGFAAVVAFVALVWWSWLRALRRGDRATAVAAVGLSFGLVAVMIHSLSDFGQHLPAIACLSAVTCGLLVNLGRREDIREGASDSRRISAIALIIGVVACVIAIWSVIGAERVRRAETLYTPARRLAARLERRGWDATRDEFTDLLTRADAAVAADPDDAHHRFRAAVWRWRMERRLRTRDDPQLRAAARDVIARLNAARALCPTYGVIYSVLGQIEQNYLDDPIGIAHMQTAWRLAQNDATAAFVAARSDALRGQWDSAIEKFRRSLDLDPAVMDDITALFLTDLDQPRRLTDVANTNWYRMMLVSIALQKDPRHHDVAMQAYARGADLLEEDLRIHPTAGNFGILAGYRATLGEFEAADRFYRRAIEMDPTKPDWRIPYADALQHMGRISDAIEQARTAVNQHPDSSEARQMLARLTALPSTTRSAAP